MEKDDLLNFTKIKPDMIIQSTYFLQLLYVTAVEYFQSEIKSIPLSVDKNELVERWSLYNKYNIGLADLQRSSSHYRTWWYRRNQTRREEALALAITPLHMHVAVHFFHNQIKNTPKNVEIIPESWDLEANILSFYKYFLEAKLKKIRFEEKNQIDLYNPDVRLTYEKELKEFLENHKKLAFYATFVEEIEEILTQDEIYEIKSIIKRFEAGEEKTGVIDYIVDGVPKFIHLTFQEYLTAQYITDILEAKTVSDETKLWIFLIRHIPQGVLEFLDRQIADQGLVIELNDETKRAIFDECTDINSKLIVSNRLFDLFFEAGEIHLWNVIRIILHSITDVVDEQNLERFLKFSRSIQLYTLLVAFAGDDDMIRIVKHIRKVDPSKLNESYGENLNGIRLEDYDDKEVVRQVRLDCDDWNRYRVGSHYTTKINNEKRPRLHSV